MGYGDLEKRVRADYEAAIAEAEARAEEERERILSRIRAEADREYSKRLAAGERRARLHGRRLVAQAKLAASREVAAAENRALADIYEECVERLASLDKKAKKKLLERFMGDAEKIGGDVVVKVAKGDARLIGSKHKVVEEDMGFGAVFESSDGSVRVDDRASEVLRRSWGRLKPEVKKILLG